MADRAFKETKIKLTIEKGIICNVRGKNRPNVLILVDHFIPFPVQNGSSSVQNGNSSFHFELNYSHFELNCSHFELEKV